MSKVNTYFHALESMNNNNKSMDKAEVKVLPTHLGFYMLGNCRKGSNM